MKRLINPVTISLAIRALGLFGRIALIYATARYYSPDELGLFNLLQAAIGFFTLLGGLELVQYLVRDLVSRQQDAQRNLIGSYMTLTAPTVLLSTIGLLSFSYYSLHQPEAPYFPLWGGFFLVSIFLTEHYSNEVQRILIGLGSPVAANLVLLLRAGLWPILVLLYAVFTGHLSLQVCFGIWGGASLLALALGVYILHLKGVLRSPKRPDSAWLKSAVTVTAPIFLGMVFQRVPFFMDKFSLSHEGLTIVGDYSILLSLALVVRMLFEASFLASRTPWLLRQNKTLRLGRDVLTVYLISLGLIIGMSIFIFLIRVPVFTLLNKAHLSHDSLAFLLLLLSINFLGAALISNLLLFAREHQKKIVFCDGLYLLIFVGVLMITSAQSILSVALAHTLAAFALFAVKTFFVIQDRISPEAKTQ